MWRRLLRFSKSSDSREQPPPDASSERLRDLLADHDLIFTPSEGWLYPPGSDQPRIKAVLVNERRVQDQTSVQLDIMVDLGKRVMIESFAGWGAAPDDARERAFANFAANSLHVLLGAFYRAPDEQITVETWPIRGSTWRAYLGNFGFQAARERPELPDGLFGAIEAAIHAAPLADDVHWARLFYANLGNGESVVEALLDNEPWPSLEATARALAWQPSEGYYSVRYFMLLRRDP